MIRTLSVTTLFSLYLSFLLLHFNGVAILLARPLFILLSGFGALWIWNAANRNLLQPFSWKDGMVVSVILVLLLFYGAGAYNGMYLLALFVFYKFSRISLTLNPALLKIAFPLLVCITSLLFIISKFTGGVSFFPNDSILSIYLAALFLMAYPGFTWWANKVRKGKIYLPASTIFYVGTVYTILFLTHGRAGILGFTFGLIFIYYQRLTAQYKYWLITVSILASFILVFFKPGSSQGRILIYKVLLYNVSFKEILFGIGYGNFKHHYNLYQANYFTTHSISNAEALLADNTFFAFNDLLQFIIEIGLVPCIILTLLLGRLAFIHRKKFKPPLYNIHDSAFTAAMLCIIIGSFFSYPFQIFPIQSIFIVQLAVVLNSIKPQHTPSNEQFHKIHFTNTTYCFIISLTLILGGILSIDYYLKANTALQLSRNGYQNKSLAYFNSVNTGFIKDGNILYNHALVLCKTNKIDAAITILKQASQLIQNDKLNTLMGELLNERKEYKAAEHYFKQAMYIVPKSFRNRFRLFQFYFDTKQVTKALYYGNELLYLSEKVPSKTVAQIKKVTRKMMATLY